MLNKYMRWVRKSALTFPKVDLKEMKPIDFQHNLTDLGRMHNLGMWHLENSIDRQANSRYLRQVEELHNEINYLQVFSLMKNFLLYFGAFWLWYMFLFDAPVDKHDFKKNFDLKFSNKLYNELDEGGIEG